MLIISKLLKTLFFFVNLPQPNLHFRGFPGGARGKEPAFCRTLERRGFSLWIGKIPWRRAWQHTLVFLPGESHGQRSLVGCSPWGPTEADTTECLSAHAHVSSFLSCVRGRCSTFFLFLIQFTLVFLLLPTQREFMHSLKKKTKKNSYKWPLSDQWD